ncbi:hypothetical protein VOLCADRAFT_98692 [Volvox carteri f. nagariensis]|uniref:BHLH domain-containing protein n=1 Tax=Volvox carteri f. nagariensis TaxID=3068 RepID=D8UG12_VOLCA|nr:uncharacterized protein VOLCADRAFT_98692 [Volvox carteri f. nagariensis]EFJ41371.1 hypothetical protein VOLCADRAFT_98692 [Volvox carteri f. nagariensis]|eukprot:XP_002957601.1 hypothetical protein VOLCADRAFT_98692 [Volvox carteri f. nagariensis]
MSDSLDFGLGDSQYVFTDRELNELLGVIEQKAAGAEAELDVLDFFRTEGKEPLALQFQPRSHKDDALEQSVTTTVKQEDLPVSALSSALASPVETPALQQSGQDQPYFSSNAAEISILPMPTGASLHAFALPGTMVGAGAHSFVSSLVAPPPVAPTQAQLTQPQPLAQLLPLAAAPLQLARLPSSAVNSRVVEVKGQISHSTVEKQRRDRINSLIDELRELVPPQSRSNNNGATGEGLEARRPKHVVLADTIQLLKHLQQKLQVTTVDQLAYNHVNGVKNQEDDTANSEGKSKGSSSQDDVDVLGAPQMPHIPCQMTQNAGVTVERGPDCYYVQVKCRDRKGLLSDIINALRQLPLEIRTAAVTTTNGTVRDVFEVKLDDASLTPEDVQNLVHDALFQQHVVAYDTYAGKRPRV